jgi:hypothetical protein
MELSRPPLVVTFELSERRKAIVADRHTISIALLTAPAFELCVIVPMQELRS